MAFSVSDLQDLFRLLEQHPEWKSALRASLLGDEWLRLPEALHKLAEEVRRLAEAQRRTEEAQRRTEERLARLEVALAELAEAQRRTEEAQRRTEQALQTLAGRVQILDERVGKLEGDSLERLYRERAASYFQDILRRIRLVDHQRLGELVDDALDAGRISAAERSEILRADVVLEGSLEAQRVYLLAEVSATVTAHDVRRARHRAELLQRATGRPVLPTVAGHCLAQDPETLQEAAQVWRVLDGKTERPGT